MNINDIDTLDKILLLMHKRNVHTMIIDGITIRLTPTDPDMPKAHVDPNAFIDPLTGMPMSDEEILFYSSTRSS